MEIQRWEYKIVAKYGFNLLCCSAVQGQEISILAVEHYQTVKLFDELGRDGWEAIGATNLGEAGVEYLFKRPKD